MASGKEAGSSTAGIRGCFQTWFLRIAEFSGSEVCAISDRGLTTT